MGLLAVAREMLGKDESNSDSWNTAVSGRVREQLRVICVAKPFRIKLQPSSLEDTLNSKEAVGMRVFNTWSNMMMVSTGCDCT